MRQMLHSSVKLCSALTLPTKSQIGHYCWRIYSSGGSRLLRAPSADGVSRSNSRANENLRFTVTIKSRDLCKRKLRLRSQLMQLGIAWKNYAWCVMKSGDTSSPRLPNAVQFRA